MTVSITTSSSGTMKGHVGTLQEVLDSIESNGHNEPKRIDWIYDDTNAKYTAIVFVR